VVAVCREQSRGLVVVLRGEAAQGGGDEEDAYAAAGVARATAPSAEPSSIAARSQSES